MSADDATTRRGVAGLRLRLRARAHCGESRPISAPRADVFCGLFTPSMDEPTSSLLRTALLPL